MAKWTDIKSKTGGSMKATIEYDRHDKTGKDTWWSIEQDEKPFIEQAKIDREHSQVRDGHIKKFATIPDIVAIEIMHNHGIDIHSPEDGSNPASMKKFKKIIMQDYPYLLSF